MKIIALPEEFVQKVNFIADCYERDIGIRPSVSAVVFASIDFCFDVVASHIGHGICEGDDE